MRYLTLFIGFIVSPYVYASDNHIDVRCSGYEASYQSRYTQGDFLECIDGSTMQSNKFIVNDDRNHVSYIITDASKIVINDEVLGRKTKGASAYFISSTKNCTEETYKKGHYYVYSRVPGDSGYCYSLDGQFIGFDNINITGYLNLKTIIKIKDKEQFLYKLDNGKFIKSQMYLEEGDSITVNKSYGDWLNVTFSGDKKITAWVPKNIVGSGKN